MNNRIINLVKQDVYSNNSIPEVALNLPVQVSMKLVKIDEIEINIRKIGRNSTKLAEITQMYRQNM